MKVLVIYSSECKEAVEALRAKIAQEFGKSSILRLNSRERKTHKYRRHGWHSDANKMIMLADIIVCMVSESTASNSNVAWELSRCLKYEKYVVCLKLNAEFKLPEILYATDPNTKEKKLTAHSVQNEEKLFEILRDYKEDKHIKLFNSENSTFNAESSNPERGTCNKGSDNSTTDTKHEKNVEVMLEQYKIFSDTAESLVNRRQSMNSFYISANTALITIGATIISLSDGSQLLSKMLILLALSIPGIMFNISWRKTLKSYFVNNKAKLKILSMIEKNLEFSLYDAEWKAMKNDFNKGQYVSFTDNEKKLPLIFIFFYGLLDVIAIVVCITLFILKLR